MPTDTLFKKKIPPFHEMTPGALRGGAAGVEERVNQRFGGGRATGGSHTEAVRGEVREVRATLQFVTAVPHDARNERGLGLGSLERAHRGVAPVPAVLVCMSQFRLN